MKLQYLLHLITNIFTPIRLQKGLMLGNLFITRIGNINTLLILTHYFPTQERNDENCWFYRNIIRISVFICNIQTRRLFCLVLHTQQRRALLAINLYFLCILKHENTNNLHVSFFFFIMHFLPVCLTVWTLKWNYALQEYVVSGHPRKAKHNLTRGDWTSEERILMHPYKTSLCSLSVALRLSPLHPECPKL
jgi:hypothetical protein